MGALQKHRDGLITAACALFRRQGFAATGLAELLAESGAPKGSLYHYFPDGKVGVAEAALRVAGQTLEAVLEKLAAAHAEPAELALAYAQLLAAKLEQSGFRDGCPIGTVMLEAAPISAKLTAAGREAFAAWALVLARRFRASGLTAARAGELAEFTISAFEGALMQARVQQSAAPIFRAAEELRRLFAASVSKKGSV